MDRLQTKLNKAVDDEDYEAAARLRDRLEGAAGAAGVCDWAALGVPTWMDDWLRRLGFAMPTRVQLQALRSLPLIFFELARSNRPGVFLPFLVVLALGRMGRFLGGWLGVWS